MGSSEAEDAGGLSPVKDGNEAAAHFNRLWRNGTALIRDD